MTDRREVGSTPRAGQLHYVLKLGPPTDDEATSWVENWNWAVRFSVIGLFALALAVVAYYASDIIVPIVLAWVVATILLPIIDFMERRKWPRLLVSVVLVLVLITTVLTLIGVLTVPLTYWVGRSSELGVIFRERLESFAEPLAFLNDMKKQMAEVFGQNKDALEVNLPSSNILAIIFSIITPVFSETVIFVFALLFNLIYQREIQDGAALLFRDKGRQALVERILRDIQVNMSVYFGTLTLVNICLGVATMLLALFVGLPHPLLWGVLAATMNYIPYLGAATVIVSLFLIGFITFSTLTHAIVAPVSYLLLTSLEGQFITPTLLGHRLTVNPFLVFVSIVFWAWIWGPVGAFVAVPMLMCGMVTVRRISGQLEPATAVS